VARPLPRPGAAAVPIIGAALCSRPSTTPPAAAAAAAVAAIRLPRRRAWPFVGPLGAQPGLFLRRRRELDPVTAPWSAPAAAAAVVADAVMLPPAAASAPAREPAPIPMRLVAPAAVARRRVPAGLHPIRWTRPLVPRPPLLAAAACRLADGARRALPKVWRGWLVLLRRRGRLRHAGPEDEAAAVTLGRRRRRPAAATAPAPAPAAAAAALRSAAGALRALALASAPRVGIRIACRHPLVWSLVVAALHLLLLPLLRLLLPLAASVPATVLQPVPCAAAASATTSAAAAFAVAAHLARPLGRPLRLGVAPRRRRTPPPSAAAAAVRVRAGVAAGPARP
jgi:hypothetical protein